MMVTASSYVAEAEVPSSIARDIGLVLIERNEVGSGHPLTLGGGLAGLAALYASLIAIDDDSGTFRREAIRCLREFDARLPELTNIKCGLFNGLAGIGWSIQYAAKRVGDPKFLDQDYTELYELVDDFLGLDEEHDYDVIGGVAGIGMFALTIEDPGWRERLVKRCLDRLESSALTEQGGIAWATPIFRQAMPVDSSHRRTPEFNLGIAHGSPGVVNFLAHCLKGSVAAEQARRLLEPAVRFICNQILPETSESAFGYVAGSKMPARAAWCYGDPGVALSLTAAADVLRSRETSEVAEIAVRRVAARTFANSGVVDTGYCHGTAGLAHVLRILFERTGISEARAGYRFWLAETVRLRQPGQGICGFRQWVTDPRHSLFADFDYLTGVIGIALVMLDEVAGPSDWAFPLTGSR
jgi:hypothetical protein